MAATKVKAIPYETAAKSFEKILIPALQNGNFSNLFEKNDAVNKAVRNMLEAASNEGKLGSAKELFMSVTKEPETAFIFLVEALPNANVFSQGKFSDVYRNNAAFNKAVNNLIEAADKAGKLDDAKDLFMAVTNQPEERFTYLVNMQQRLREGSIAFSPPFSDVAKRLATG